MQTVDWKTITKNSYNEHADQFAIFASIFRGKLKKWIETFVGEFKIGDQILDLGCGAGRDAKFFLNNGLQVTGIDNSDKLIALAKDKVKHGAFFVMDFEDLTLPDESFAGVWANASLLHLPKDRVLPVLKKIHQILKDDGIFFSSWRAGEGEKFTIEKRGNADLKRFYAYYNSEELRKLLEKAGFTVEEEELDEIASGTWIGIFARK